MSTVKCEEVIICEIELRGKGVDTDPLRKVRQVFNKKGELIAEDDPCLSVTIREAVAELKRLNGKTDIIEALQKLNIEPPVVNTYLNAASALDNQPSFVGWKERYEKLTKQQNAG